MPLRPTVRLVLAVSLDGRLAFPGGGPAQLGGAGDRQVLEQALAWADGCLMGAGTLRAHHCTCLIRESGLLEERAKAQRSPQPTACVVSRSATPTFPVKWPFFQQPVERWLLHGAEAAAHAATPAGFSQGLAMGATWQETLAHLAAQGMQRLVLLGGALVGIEAQACTEEGATCTDETAQPGDACEDITDGCLCSVELMCLPPPNSGWIPQWVLGVVLVSPWCRCLSVVPLWLRLLVGVLYMP